MKNQGGRGQRCLQLLIHLNILRQDCCFFSKLLLFDWHKKSKEHLISLSKLQSQMYKRQQQLIRPLHKVDINEYWKSQLFSHSNRIAKIIKNFQGKLLNISPKMSELNETTVFLQQLRNYCIQKLSEYHSVGQFMKGLYELLHRRYQTQIATFTSNPSKIIDLIKRQDSTKTNRYFFLIEQFGSSLYFQSNHKALQKMDIQLKKINKDHHQDIINSINYFYSVMHVQQEHDNDVYYLQNGMTVNFNYFQQGLCQFLVSKWQRIFKDYKHKNQVNQNIIKQYYQKYSSKRKNKYLALKNQRQSTLSVHQNRNQAKTLEISHFNSSFQALRPTTNKNQKDVSQRKPVFRIPSISSKKKSTILKPLVQLKQNKEAFPQKIIHMKMAESTPQAIKNMRIRRRKAFNLLKDQSYWSLLMRDPKQKLTICLH